MKELLNNVFIYLEYLYKYFTLQTFEVYELGDWLKIGDFITSTSGADLKILKISKRNNYTVFTVCIQN